MGPLTTHMDLFVILVFLMIGVHFGNGIHTQFCFRFPSGSFPDSTYQFTGQGDVASVGMEKFPQNVWKKYAFSLEETFTDGFPAPGRTAGDDAISGWFRVQIGLPLSKAWTEFIKSFILFAVDEQGNFVGTWEHAFNDADHSNDCPPGSESKYMIIPCGGVSKYEAHASNAIVYARNLSRDKTSVWPTQFQKYWPIVPDYSNTFELSFYFKFSKLDSNRNRFSVITIKLLMDPDHEYTADVLDPSILRTDLEYGLLTAAIAIDLVPESVPGAADPLPTLVASMTCSMIAQSPNGGRVFNGEAYRKKNYNIIGWNWYFIRLQAENLREQNDPTNPGRVLLTSLAVVPFYTAYTRTGCTAKFYGGRCDQTLCSISNQQSHGPRNKANKDLIPQVHSTTTAKCTIGGSPMPHAMLINEEHDTPKYFNNQPTQFGDWFNHYKDQLTGARCSKTEVEAGKAVNRVKVIRHKPKNVTIINITVQNATLTVVGTPEKATNKTRDLYRRGVRQYGSATVLYAIRKGHGIVMLIVSMLCVPICIFASRYFKETFMSMRILYARVWFQIHLQMVFWMCAMFFTGLLLPLVGRAFLGVSLVPFAFAHRVIGWMSFALFVILVATGGIRLMDDPGRKITIGAHWAMGYIFYFLNMVAIITSLYIPGSPAANHDESSEAFDDSGTINKLSFILGGWIIFEFVINITMNFLMHTYDRWMNVTEPRKYIPPLIGVPIPVLKENSDSDASGSGIRLIIFCIYTGLALLATFLSVLMFLLQKANESLGFGPMSCTHAFDKALDPSGSDDSGIYQYKLMDKVDPSCRYTPN